MTGIAGQLVGFDNDGLATELDPDVIASGSTRLARAADRSGLAALSTTLGGAYLHESGREGLFVWDGSDLSAEVTADTGQGLFVPPASDATGASGAWVRKFHGSVNPAWFGIAEGAVSGANASANNTAWSKVKSCLSALTVNLNSNKTGGHRIEFGLGTFEFSSPLDLDWGTIIVSGQGGGSDAGPPTKLKFYGCTGIRVQSFDTSGASTKDSPDHVGSQWTVIRDIMLAGNHNDTEVEAEFHGVHAKSCVHLYNVNVRHFAGNGFHLEGNTPTVGGTVDSSIVQGCRAYFSRNGFYCNGGDSNVISFIGCLANSNRQWGFWDSSFLGNTYVACETNGNGGVDGDSAPSGVWDGARSYFVIQGQEAGASTNAPSGTTADNTWWAFWQAGKANASLTAWSSGTTYRAGGSYSTDSLTGYNVLVGCYAEIGQPLAQLSFPTRVPGGHITGGGLIWTGSTALWAYANGSAGTKQLSFNSKISVDAQSIPTFTANLGTHNLIKTALAFSDTVQAPDSFKIKLSSGDVVFDYNDTNIAWRVTGPSTSQQFGTGAAVSYAFHAPLLMLPDQAGSATNARRIFFGTAAPTTGAHAVGEICKNRTPSVGNPKGWVCTVAGTPGTWVSEGNL